MEVGGGALYSSEYGSTAAGASDDGGEVESLALVGEGEDTEREELVDEAAEEDNGVLEMVIDCLVGCDVDFASCEDALVVGSFGRDAA